MPDKHEDGQGQRIGIVITGFLLALLALVFGAMGTCVTGRSSATRSVGET
jgi:hypothetical protein